MAPRSEDPKLIIPVISFELTQHIRPWYINVMDGRTDGQTDGRMTYDSNTALALCASRGNNQQCMRRGLRLILVPVNISNCNLFPSKTQFCYNVKRVILRQNAYTEVRQKRKYKLWCEAQQTPPPAAT